MNLNQLWAGNDYAYYEWRSRGERYRSNAVRVRIIRAFQERVYGNERLSGYAEVYYLNDDGEVRTYTNGEPVVKKVRARDIAMRWDEYADEREHREAERERIQREQEEREAAEAARKTAFIDALVSHYKIPRDAIINVTPSSISISRRAIERELANGEQASQ